MFQHSKRFLVLLMCMVSVSGLSACAQNTAPPSTVSAGSDASAVSTQPSADSDADVPSQTAETSGVSVPSGLPTESGVDAASGTPAEPRQETVSDTPADASTLPSEVSASRVNHPSSLVGTWSLVLDTTELDASQQAEASDKMENISIVLHADGTATGVSGNDRISGDWGESSGYVYVTLGEATEYFWYYIDRLESLNYQGMSFVR